MPPFTRAALAGLSALLLAGCAGLSIDQALQATNRTALAFTQGNVELSRTVQQREARERLATQLLEKPLAMDDAVQLALANSPALQALLADGWQELASANQYGRIANPVFEFERVRSKHELEFGRLLSVGLLDLLTLPRRHAIAQARADEAATQLSGMVVDHVSQVRQAWVRAVGAQQTVQYATQVQQAADAGAELARRMQQVGNFTKLQRARQQAFYADATAQLASSQHAATASREALVRLLGLDDRQAAQLRLPERLPDLPSAPLPAAEVTAAALQQRLDVQLARQQLDAAGRSQGLELLNRLVDVELGVRRDTVFDDGERDKRRGFELAIRLPLFDWGGAQRDAMNAQSLAAANRYDSAVRAASSQMRESYSAYRTAYDLAKHYRDEIVPLRRLMAEENLLRYNGMFIGVFELLADTREQIGSVSAAIAAQQQFWLADAGLASTLIGRPMATGATPMSASTPGANEGPGH